MYNWSLMFVEILNVLNGFDPSAPPPLTRLSTPTPSNQLYNGFYMSSGRAVH